jgi:DNA-binding MarR family transcriptional regulator
MTPTRAAESESPRWLDDEQQVAWRAFNSMMIRLRWAQECQLQRDAGLSFIEYHALAMLSEQPDHTIRMSELAQLTNASLSRLSHLVKRLEQRELVRREPDPADGRFTNAILTPTGLCLLVASAPAHVAKVRELVIDALSPAELRQLGAASERILERVENDPDLALVAEEDDSATERPGLGEPEIDLGV